MDSTEERGIFTTPLIAMAQVLLPPTKQVELPIVCLNDDPSIEVLSVQVWGPPKGKLQQAWEEAEPADRSADAIKERIENRLLRT